VSRPKRYKVGRPKTRRQVRAAKPEEILFDWWMEARLKRDRTKNSKIRRKYMEQADRLQYALQDASPLGHRMVWGSEYGADRDRGYTKEELAPREPVIGRRWT
jgi:hypothetical protein